MTKCPKCESTNIAHPKYSSIIIRGMLIEHLRYECECGYSVITEPKDKQRRDAAKDET